MRLSFEPQLDATYMLDIYGLDHRMQPSKSRVFGSLIHSRTVFGRTGFPCSSCPRPNRETPNRPTQRYDMLYLIVGRIILFGDRVTH